jgi:putative ubiquitin-RnfH superfamily antitoxin RatB of RatAB toxin-antitoxin module
MTQRSKTCEVAYAAPERQYLWTVELPLEATISDAIAAARVQAAGIDIPWDTAVVGIFGETRKRDDVPINGDRIELYRPLRADPRERRRERVRQNPAGRRAGR